MIQAIKKRYYLLLGFNLAVFMLKIIAIKLSVYTLPEEVYEVSMDYARQCMQDRPVILNFIYVELGRIMLFVYAAAIFSLFIGENCSRRFYVAVVCINAALLMMSGFTFRLVTNYAALLSAVQHIIEGVVIYSVFWGEAAVLFKNNELWLMKRNKENTVFFRTAKGRKILRILLTASLVLIASAMAIAITGFGNIPSMLNTPTEYARKMLNNVTKEKYDLSSKQFENQFFKLITPQDWHAQFCDDQPSLYISNLLSNKSFDGDFGRNPVILFGCGLKESTQTFSGGFYTFLFNNPETQVFTKDINGKTASVSRYSGRESWHHEKENNVAINDINSTTILIEFDDLDFIFAFWGFEEDEKVFWDCLNSIQWKEQKD